MNTVERMQSREKVEGGERYVVRFGMVKIGQQSPYFSITCDTYKHGRMVAGGCQHGVVERLWPDLYRLIRWHLCDQDGIPMHYISNGRYWFQVATDQRTVPDHLRQSPLDILVKHVVMVLP